MCPDDVCGLEGEELKSPGAYMRRREGDQIYVTGRGIKVRNQRLQRQTYGTIWSGSVSVRPARSQSRYVDEVVAAPIHLPYCGFWSEAQGGTGVICGHLPVASASSLHLRRGLYESFGHVLPRATGESCRFWREDRLVVAGAMVLSPLRTKYGRYILTTRYLGEVLLRWRKAGGR